MSITKGSWARSLSLCLWGGWTSCGDTASFVSGSSRWTHTQHSAIARSAHTAYLCVFCGSENKQRSFPYTALTDWFFCNRDLTLCSPVVAICTTSLTFNNSTFCPHGVFMCFVWISEQTAIISLYSNNWLVFCNRDLTLCSPVVTICTTSLTFNNSAFYPHSAFVCFVWISEQTAIIYLYNINWLVCITEI